MRSVLIRKIGGIVGLLAILLTTLVPAASQMIERGRIESTLASFCSAGVSSNPKQTPDDHAAHWQACGYCSFTAHTPFMAPPKHTQRAASIEGSARIATGRVATTPYAPILAAKPRAPPSFA
ncbi:DUF2946 domain-containing protein [Caballeronia humi]|uniref:MFS transporter n=1 Tax=Caballeronia humi TaxID=326474 RepID=A0A158FQM1_9BURK|nr:DUF2946 domain-containing protein [Caballeronia humi]SAL22148.1 MFS transporter [Caballeronia humi]